MCAHVLDSLLSRELAIERRTSERLAPKCDAVPRLEAGTSAQPDQRTGTACAGDVDHGTATVVGTLRQHEDARRSLAVTGHPDSRSAVRASACTERGGRDEPRVVR